MFTAVPIFVAYGRHRKCSNEVFLTGVIISLHASEEHRLEDRSQVNQEPKTKNSVFFVLNTLLLLDLETERLSEKFCRLSKVNLREPEVRRKPSVKPKTCMAVGKLTQKKSDGR